MLGVLELIQPRLMKFGQTIISGPWPLGISLNDPNRAGGLTANTPKFHDITYNNTICTIYNMSGRVVSDIQTRAEGESLYI